MVSLSSPRTAGPLLLRLASSPRPALMQAPDAGPDAPAGPAPGSVDERIELSGTVLVNWAAKTAGLLADEGLTPGDTLRVDLPEHWLCHALTLGALVAEARLGFGGPQGPAPAFVLTDRPQAWTDPSVTVLHVRLPRGLAPQAEGVPHPDPAVVDVATEIRAQPDALPGPAAHVHADSLDAPDGLDVPGTADDAGPRLDRARAAAALRTWGAGGTVTVRG
ncbi:TIGR03089 family protein [Micrococcus sp.]|uniref:TIGR03089 family protein n=1 Tax=Micrococcus sp. TaxID=1271 RepID=UPI002A9199C3|nr:TIGR03089 family protein [Micrococcus sp.]MDY6055343.1 TIGR03089 family protein [Micrococcus sp.]